MRGFFKKTYNFFKRRIEGFKRAKSFKSEEFLSEFVNIRARFSDYLRFEQELSAKKKVDLFNLEFLKNQVKGRYWSNINRVLLGKDLVQDEESSLGLKYVFEGGPCFAVIDTFKYESARSSLEEKLNIYSKKVSAKTNIRPNTKYESIDETINYSDDLVNTATNNPSQTQKRSANYISSFSKDSYTNSVASLAVSSKKLSNLAGVLSGYVNVGTYSIGPIARSWDVRVNELEDLVNSGFNITSADLSRVKSVLAKNSYLIKKRPEVYAKVLDLLEHARGNHDEK